MSISRTSICFSHVSWCCPHLIGCEKCNNKYPKIELRDKVVGMKELCSIIISLNRQRRTGNDVRTTITSPFLRTLFRTQRYCCPGNRGQHTKQSVPGEEFNDVSRCSNSTYQPRQYKLLCQATKPLRLGPDRSYTRTGQPIFPSHLWRETASRTLE